MDNELIPTGEFRDVNKTPFDFRNPKAIGQQISDKNTQLEIGMGYDRCWVLNDQDKGLRFVASAYEPASGRMLEVFSDEPSIQLNSGNFLDGTLPNKSNGTYLHRTGFCFETQHYPDLPNQKNFPSVRLNPGEKHNSKTVFRLSAVSK